MTAAVAVSPHPGEEMEYERVLSGLSEHSISGEGRTSELLPFGPALIPFFPRHSVVSPGDSVMQRSREELGGRLFQLRSTVTSQPRRLRQSGRLDGLSYTHAHSPWIIVTDTDT